MKCLVMILPALLLAAPAFAQNGSSRDPLLDGPSMFSANRQQPSTNEGPIVGGGRPASSRQMLSFVGVTRDDQNVMTAFIELGTGSIVQVRDGGVIPGDGRVIVDITFKSLQISTGGTIQVLPIRDIWGNSAGAPRSPAMAPGTRLNAVPPATRRPVRSRGTPAPR